MPSGYSIVVPGPSSSPRLQDVGAQAVGLSGQGGNRHLSSQRLHIRCVQPMRTDHCRCTSKTEATSMTGICGRTGRAPRGIQEKRKWVLFVSSRYDRLGEFSGRFSSEGTWPAWENPYETLTEKSGSRCPGHFECYSRRLPEVDRHYRTMHCSPNGRPLEETSPLGRIRPSGLVPRSLRRWNAREESDGCWKRLWC